MSGKVRKIICLKIERNNFDFCCYRMFLYWKKDCNKSCLFIAPSWWLTLFVRIGRIREIGWWWWRKASWQSMVLKMIDWLVLVWRLLLLCLALSINFLQWRRLWSSVRTSFIQVGVCTEDKLRMSNQIIYKYTTNRNRETHDEMFQMY